MLINTKVKIKLNKTNINHFKNKGYKFDKNDKELIVNTIDLKSSSTTKVLVYCDYCGRIYKTPYRQYLRGIKTINKVCCNNTNCMKLKRNESNKLKYGCENQFQRKKIKDDIKKQCLEEYGVEYYNQLESTIQKRKDNYFKLHGVINNSQTDEWLNQIKINNLKKYGTEFYFQTEKFKNNLINDNMKKYGVKYYNQTKECREKMKKTNIKKYGFPCAMQNKKIILKIKQTMYKNGTCTTSRQQLYLHFLLGGELNYSNDTPNLDIAFPSEMIYLEYDGGGHDLSVRLGHISEQEFKNRQMRRNYYLSRRGWRQIRIISKQDKLPNDKILLEMIIKAKQYLNNGRHWIEFYIDDNIVKSSQFEKEYNYGKLRKIYDIDLN